ncbi:mannonate dehydratase [Saccharibacillus sp. CPCC 101409]|uniref:mannonate dehydratase n=1 Tax=Saccharibacillus sp. CPCC 101409 TaxID=3058041 RepID=UPI002672D752|nr:mannonate dehydratase [Saccharibacillus sp. CPCC 101409]MDO3410128.1 mannonate dehydratase [Saccharibacillus sp. CPCC 101409]
MKMTWRWYGEGNDNITLDQIRQIPGVSGIVWSLHHKTAGEVWEMDEIRAEADRIASKGFSTAVVESVNVHDDIKIGLPSRDRYIDIYADTIRKLAAVGVKVICYNFMPIFDWTRTDLYRELPDGSNALFYEKASISENPYEMAEMIIRGGGEFTIPGWEPDRLARLDELFAAYAGVTEEILFDNLVYFLERIVPVCEEFGVKMAIHPDDPAWPIFGLPRIVRSRETIRRLLRAVDSPCNGLTFCSGSLGTSPLNDLPAILTEFIDRVHFAHLRNVRVFENGDFIEVSHRLGDGSVNLPELVRILHEHDYEGYIRPDHGRHLWGEESRCRPGYGLYDRAFGVMYLLGVWDGLGDARRAADIAARGGEVNVGAE